MSLHEEDRLLLVGTQDKVFLLRDDLISSTIPLPCTCPPLLPLKTNLPPASWPLFGWMGGCLLYSGKGGCLHSSSQEGRPQSLFSQPVQVLCVLRKSVEVLVGSDFLLVMQPLIESI